MGRIRKRGHLRIRRILQAHDLDEGPHTCRRAVKCGALFCREVYFDHLFDATRTELARHTDEEVVYSVLTFKVRR